MRKVVDSNFLQTPQLADFLANPSNSVVLPDYVAMEAYKGQALTSIQRSMSVISRYPRQVIVLKGTQTICGLRGRRAGLQRRMIDPQQSRDFVIFCRDLEAAINGDQAFTERLLELRTSASSFMDNLLQEAKSLAETFREVQNTYSEEEIRRLRRKGPFTREFLEKLQKNTMLTAAFLLRDHPKVNKFPNAAEARNTLIFRFSICIHLLVLHWISVGSGMNAKPEKLVNDKVDMMLVAYGTFFDGILSNDNKVQVIYERAIAALDGLFAR